MTLFLHELKRNRLSLVIWTSAIAFMIGICVLIYPEMASQMNEISDMFANMGSFSAAFGMDQINFGEFIGYFGVECGEVIGLGGAIFAAILGVSALAKEERGHTAEILLTHPISRTKVVTGKLLAVFTQILLLNVGVIAVTLVSILIIGERVPVDTVALLFAAYILLQLEIGALTFGLSAFVKGNGLGLGLGLSIGLYFLNLVSNLVEETKFLKYITPFGYIEGADIISNNALNGAYIAVGGALSAVAVAAAYIHYRQKDMAG